MAGAVDLFAGSKSPTGANLFTVDKNPLNQLFEGIDDVIGKQAGDLGANLVTGVLSYVQKIAGAIIDAILGLPLELLSSIEPALLQSFQNVDKFFTNILGFLGGIDPLSELFSIETAAQNFINSVLAETGLLPILDEAGHLAQAPLQPLIDALVNSFINGATTNNSISAISTNIQAGLQGLLSTAADNFDGTANALASLVFRGDGTALASFGATLTSPLSALIDNADGTVAGLANLLIKGDGTAVFGAPSINIASLANQFDGTAMSMATAVQNAAAGPAVFGRNLTTALDSGRAITDAINQAVYGGVLTGYSPDSVKAALQNFPGANIVGSIAGGIISGATAIEQQIIDAIANALGHAGTGHTPSDILGYLGLIPGANITGALNSAVTVAGTQIGTLLQYLSASGQFNAAQLTGALNSALTFSGTALSTLLQNLNSSGQFNAAQLTGALNTALTFSGTALSTLLQNLNASGQFSAAAITGALNSAVTVAGTQLGTLLQYLNASGQFNAAQLTGTVAASIISGALTSATIAGSSITGSIAAALISGVTTTEQAITDAVHQALYGDSAVNNAVSSIKTGLQSALNGLLPAVLDNFDGTGNVLSGVTFNADGTAIFNQVAGATWSLINNLDGTAMSIASAVQNTTNYATANWQTLLGQTGLASPDQLVSSLQGLLPAALDQLDGTAVATVNGAAQIVQNLDGTATYVAQQATNAISTLVDNVDGTAMSMANAVAGAVAGAQAVGSNIAQGVSGFWGSIFGALNGAATPPAATPAQAYTALANQQATTASNSANIGGMTGLTVASVNQALQKSSAGLGGSSGTNVTVNFSSYANALNLSAAGFSGAVGSIGINGGQAAWVAASGANPTFVTAYYTTPTVSDYQVVSMVLGAANNIAYSGAACSSYLLGRCNSAMNTYAYLKLGGGGAVLGFVIAGSDSGFGWYISHTPIIGAVYELICGDEATSNLYSYKVLCNGTQIGSTYADSGHVSQVGSSYRYAGLAMSDSVVQGSGNYPASLSSWGVADNAPPTTIGSGFRAYRASTSTVTPSSGATWFSNINSTTFPASTFDTVQWNTSDLTWGSSTNTLTVTIAGWYTVTVGAIITTTGSEFAAPALYHNGTFVMSGDMGALIAGGNTMPIQSTFTVYCAANDTLAPGFAFTTALAFNMKGDTVGAGTYFQVALANCGTLS